ncbi:Unc-80-like protein [Elysia marginata]|uniref:Unc-80-like protein n=1 Tax=Elysia marginata TaxID=1093978 RepID=A0AAV4FK08_9GAST|nr:Unc-80-like protein [Elysia marginata]
MLACLVLVEVTTFLRETFQYLPRSRSQKREHLWEKNVTSRRYSSIVSSPGHSDRSSESNVAELPSGISNIGSPGDRKISFAVLTERSDSLHSSTASLSQLEPGSQEEKKEKGRRLAQGRQKLLRHFRRGSGHNLSFRRSFKLGRPDSGSGSIRQHGGSIKSRKISSHSLQSDAKYTEDDGSGVPYGGGEDTESVTMMSDDTNQESPVDKDTELEDEHLYTNLPWIKVVVQLANLSNFICPHHNFCHPNCYERQRRSCSRLTTALRKIYDSTEEDERIPGRGLDGSRSKDAMRDKLKRRESIFQVTSPSTRRRESTPLLEKIKTDVSMTKLKLNSTWKKDDKPKEAKEDAPIVKYLTSQAQRLTQCPMAILTKAAPVLNVEHFIDIMPVAWELMLESDQELAAAAASVFLLSSAKSSDKARNMIIKEMQHEETTQRINAVLRFGALWKFRYQVWPRMEDGANMYFKLPPPSIDFTLPSPCIGLPSLTVIDPPWMPHFKTNIEEVTVNQEETKSLVTATTTRRKQQQEMIRKALLAEEERKREGRENFPMTTVPVTSLAAYEPLLHHGESEHEEVAQEEMTLAARRVSLAPTNRANNQSRSMSWRNGSLHWGRLAGEGDEDRLEHGQHLQTAQSVFPSCICAAVLPVLHLLDDHDVNADGVSVAEVAYKVIWDCIVDDPILFLRHFLEKLTNKDRQEELMFLLRKLILYFPQMPAQAAHSIFNYLIGYIMFYVRTPCEAGQDAISGALSLLWLCIPSVEGIYFKDLKQTLKKEQCDPFLLVSASVASAKKILVHGPDLSSIPSQLFIHEDTQFLQILQESLEFFNIPDDQHNSHFLVDTKTHQIHNSSAYVRDFYFFRRNFYPQLSLVKMNPDDAKLALQRRVFMLKFVEVGKVLLTNAVMESTPAHQVQNHVSFLHEELSKLPSFPRKALEAEFDMYSGGWGKLMSTIFSSMSSTFTWSNDLTLFIHVLNGTIVLQFEDTAILRFCLATLINTCRHFKHIFATNGFLHIMPTLLRVYSNNQPNPVLQNAIQFVCKQFYILHRKPFILQMFGSVAPILDMTCAADGAKDCTKVQPSSLFKLLLALEKDCPDHLSVLDLVVGEQPLKALDFCYENDPDTFNMMDVINMCVTVIAYSPESYRSGQMLTILEMVIPRYLDHLKQETNKKDNSTAARAEVAAINSLAVAVRALVMCCESFARNMSLPQRFLESNNASGSKPTHNHSIHSLTVDDREDSHASRHMEEGRRKTYGQEPDDLELREEFRKPRDSLLSVSAEFYTRCHARLKELRKMLADPAFRPPELFDNKVHNRLAEVAHTLLKLAPYDPLTMACSGLQRYMLEILPNTDWSHELIRPGLNLILRRLDRLFTKISKKSALRRPLDWEAAANILKGVYLTLRKFSFVALLPHLKTLVNILITILLTSTGTGSLLPESLINPGSSHRGELSGLQTDASPLFVSSVVKLVAMQMQALGDQYSLEHICGGVSGFCANEKSLNLLINFILPLCIRVGSHCRDTPRMSQTDITFVLTVITNLLGPSISSNMSSQNQHNSIGQGGLVGKSSNYLSIGEQGRSSSVSHSWDGKATRPGMDLHHQTALLGLEILMVCFDKQLAPQWHQVAKAIITMASKGKKAIFPEDRCSKFKVNASIATTTAAFKWLSSIEKSKAQLFNLLLLSLYLYGRETRTPIEALRMMQVNCDTAQEYYLQQTIRDKLQGYTFSYHKSASSILVTLALELRQLRDELASSLGAYRSRAATSVTEHSDYSQTQFQERLPSSSITEIAAEIIGPTKASHSSLIKRSSRATLFSQSSSTGSVPPQPQQRSHSQSGPLISTETSPTAAATSAAVAAMAALHRSRSASKSSKRITAREGSRILDKYARKNEDGADIPMPHSPLLHRQGTIRFRGNLSASKQNSLELEGPLAHVVYENEDAEAEANGKAGEPSGVVEGLTPGGVDPRDHRLQRQDAKSRKTFKIKRVKTKTSVRPRFMSHRRRPDGGTAGLQGDDPLPLTHSAHKHTSGLQRPGAGSMARSVETIPEAAEIKSARLKFLQRSKSHDEPSGDPRFHQSGERDRDKPTHSSVRTGRIHRKGARIVHSRSPSVSPSVSPRPSYHRRKPKDQLDYQNRCTQAETPQTQTSPKGESHETVSVIESHKDIGDEGRTVTERGLQQRFSASLTKDKVRGRDQWQSDLGASGSSLTSPASLEEGNREKTQDNKTTSDSFVSFSSLDTVVSLVDHTKDGSIKCVTSPLSAPPVTETTKSDAAPDTPTRRMAVRFPQGKSLDSRPMSGPATGNNVRVTGASSQIISSALEQIKQYGSPPESSVSMPSTPAYTDSATPSGHDISQRERKQGNAPIQHTICPSSTSNLFSPSQKPSLATNQEVAKSVSHSGLTGHSSPQLSPTSPPPQPSTHSGSSSQTSPSHVTSFSSSPNDSPVRKPSFSSSATSPTRHFSYSSSSTMDSPTHKLFVSYRNSPSHRIGLLTSPTREQSRKTSFSSSSHGSPVRKPSFSSSSESQHQQNYSSTTSSQSSILSSPTHAPGSKSYGGTFSPKDTSPVRSPAKSFGRGTFSPYRSPVTSPLASPDRGTGGLRSSGVVNKGFVNTTPYTVRAKRYPITSPSSEANEVIKYGRPPSPKMESSTQHVSMIPKAAATAKAGDSNMKRSMNMSSQIPGSTSSRYSSPPKPSTLKLKDQASGQGSRKEPPTTTKTQPYSLTGAAPLSSPDPDTFDPLYSRPKVQGLVSRFERKPPGPSGDAKATRQGGPQSFGISASPLSSSESRMSTPAAGSSKFSPPAYTYTSPLSSSRPSSRFSSQTSPQSRPYPYLLSPYSPQQSSSLSPPSASNRQKATDESSLSSSVYVARCDSSDSLSANESSSLLRDEEKSDSMSSLYYADEDIPDAV